MRALIVLTSQDKLPDSARKTGIQLKSFAAAYFAFLDAGFDVVVASPLGGHTPLDPDQYAWAAGDGLVQRFSADQRTREDLFDALALAQICPTDFSVAYYADGAGALADLVDDPWSEAFLQHMRRAGKPVGFAGYGVAALLKAVDGKGASFLKGLRATGPTESDDRANGIPLGLPSLAREAGSLGALYIPGEPSSSHAIQDVGLITGRDVTSSARIAHLLIAATTTT
jgi:putative intracellular protease/amidase